MNEGQGLVFDKDAVKVLINTRDLLEEMIETIDILADEEMMRKIDLAEKDVKDGKVRDFDDFLEELK
ncbi:MAG: hypothetical protein KJ886_03870 [Candidatus Thermoplasmatota archaeon]|nr:hypothetical protein [Candidatus Thermoplasmatota archaeon]MBU4255691.1 hypothetical protein [Candidatus Thermoplasmatota archaeon]MCG2826664.1 hypothetical protein [Thermoplasmatales archaeon]